jgi:hypothetical protein
MSRAAELIAVDGHMRCRSHTGTTETQGAF